MYCKICFEKIDDDNFGKAVEFDGVPCSDWGICTECMEDEPDGE